jgi:regulator of RNase E activity RraA
MGKTTIHPGDIIYGDIDGVLVIPREHEQEIIQKAYEKVKGENLVAEAIRAGMSTVEAFSTFGIM